MTTCYNCSSKAIHALNFKIWKPVCDDCSKEAIKEEGIIEVMNLTRWEAIKHEQAGKALTA